MVEVSLSLLIITLDVNVLNSQWKGRDWHNGFKMLNYAAIVQNSFARPSKPNPELLCDPAILLLGMYL